MSNFFEKAEEYSGSHFDFSDEAIATTEVDLASVLKLALEVLESGEFQEKWEIAKIFRSLGKTAIAPLIEVLQNQDADLDTRWFAVRILGDFGDPAVITALVEVLKNNDNEELATMVGTTLTNFGITALSPLVNFLKSEDTRLIATQAIAHIRHPETIEPLLTIIKDQHHLVRATAIEALSSFPDQRIPPRLLEALKDPAAIVRKEAIIGLSVRKDLLLELDLVNQIAPLLKDLNLEVCQQAAIALGRFGTNSSVTELFDVLIATSTPDSLRIDTIRTLGWMGTTTAIEYLEKALFLDIALDPNLCEEIIAVLGRVTEPDLQPKIVDILLNFINSGSILLPDVKIQLAIALGLGQLGDPRGIESLIELLGASDARVRLHTIAALKKIDVSLAYQQLQDLLKTENLPANLSRGIAIALQEW